MRDDYLAHRRKSFRSFIVSAVDFDGTNNYMLRGAGLTGAADSKVGIWSLWADFNSDGASGTFIYGQSGNPNFGRVNCADNKLCLVWSGGGGHISTQSANTVLAASGWRHILFSWDVGASVSHLYVDDADVNNEQGNVDGLLDWTNSDWGIGGQTAGPGNSKMNAYFAEYYLAAEYIDLSVAANRAKFISGGKPVYLGSDGSKPTGTQPLIYLSVRPDDAGTVFAVNKGSGGDFNITGGLSIAPTSPSD